MSAHNGRLFLHTCAECEAPTDNKSMICDECAPLYDPALMAEDIANNGGTDEALHQENR